MDVPPRKFEVAHDLIVESESPYLALDRHKLELEFREIEDQHAKSRGHRLSGAITASGFALVFLFPILAADFNSNFLGLSAGTWEGMAIMGIIGSLSIAVWNTGWWVVHTLGRNKPPTPAERVKRLIREMQSTPRQT